MLYKVKVQRTNTKITLSSVLRLHFDYVLRSTHYKLVFYTLFCSVQYPVCRQVRSFPKPEQATPVLGSDEHLQSRCSSPGVRLVLDKNHTKSSILV